MHTRLLHSSKANLSAHPAHLIHRHLQRRRRDTVSPNPLPSRYAGEIVRGEASGRVRCCDYQMALPEVPESASFFDQQAKQNDA